MWFYSGENNWWWISIRVKLTKDLVKSNRNIYLNNLTNQKGPFIPESFISRSVAILVVMSGLKREAVVAPLGLDLTPTPGSPDRSRELALLLRRSLQMLKGESMDRSLSCGSSLMWTWLEEASTDGDVCCWASTCNGDTSAALRSVVPLSPNREPSPSVSVVSSSFTLTSVRGKCWWHRMWSFRLKCREEVKGQSSHWNVSPRSWCWCTWKEREGSCDDLLSVPTGGIERHGFPLNLVKTIQTTILISKERCCIV